MKVALKINFKHRHPVLDVYHVLAYEITDSNRLYLGTYAGTIEDICKKIEFCHQAHVNIERSIFEGWY